MRAVKRWLRQIIGEWRIRHRRREIAAELAAQFSLKAVPRFVLSGARGSDSNYFIFNGKNRMGVLRLINPYKKRTPPPADFPFRLEEGPRRIAREWNAYAAGSKRGLTPLPLWRGEDFLFCEYLPFRSMQEILQKNTEKAWPLLRDGSQTLHALHQCGYTHMDASLANILTDAFTGRDVLIDFEYTPAPGMSLEAQQLYDHLRLLESTWKFMTPAARADFREWLVYVFSIAGAGVRKSDLDLLAPALGRILADPLLGPAIREKF